MIKVKDELEKLTKEGFICDDKFFNMSEEKKLFINLFLQLYYEEYEYDYACVYMNPKTNKLAGTENNMEGLCQVYLGYDIFKFYSKDNKFYALLLDAKVRLGYKNDDKVDCIIELDFEFGKHRQEEKNIKTGCWINRSWEENNLNYLDFLNSNEYIYESDTDIYDTHGYLTTEEVDNKFLVYYTGFTPIHVVSHDNTLDEIIKNYGNCSYEEVKDIYELQYDIQDDLMFRMFYDYKMEKRRLK